MGGWGEYGLAMGLFIASHFLPRIGGLRERLIGAVGRRMYFSVYGMLSLLLLAWVIVAAGRAPYVELWTQMPWMRWLPNLAMPLAGLLVICGAGVNNPWTLGGRGDVKSATGGAPGFAALSRHPLLVALGLWAASHAVVNGDLAHLTLFGDSRRWPLGRYRCLTCAQRGRLAVRRPRSLSARRSCRPHRWRIGAGGGRWGGE